jgi:hypothetical protein
MIGKKNIDEGGFAFPTSPIRGPNGRVLDHGSDGMSLRDWFAGQALAGMLAMPSDTDSGNFHNNCGEPFVGAAGYAYRMADAMIAARKAGAA